MRTSSKTGGTLLRAWPLLAVVAACAGFAGVARAEQPTAEYIEYRAQPELGRVSISDNTVRGKKAVEHLTAHAAELEKKGIFACTDEEKPHAYRRREKLAGRKIETFVVILPPAPAEGDPGDEEGPDDEPATTQRLIVRVDGRTKIACSIGTSSSGELWVSQVIIHPEEGTIEIHALTSEGEELTLPDDWLSLDDRTLITDQSFFEDEPDVRGEEAGEGLKAALRARLRLRRRA